MSYQLVTRPHIKGLSDLKGAKLGISCFGSSSEFATRLLLKKIGVDPKDVAILQIGNESERLVALSFTRIHGSVFNAPFSLCDMGIKFADVVSVREVIEELRTRAGVGTKDQGEKLWKV